MTRSKYSKGGNILCYHGPLLYEAKVLKIRREKTRGQSKVAYLVHYKGWKTKWDEWVGEDRIVPLDEEGIELAQQLRTLNAGNKDAEKKLTRTKDQLHKKRPSNSPTRVDEKTAGAKTSRRFANHPMGDRIRRLLATEWDLISKKQHLYELPASKNVRQILDLFSSNDGRLGMEVDTFCKKISILFKIALPKMLLYRFEKMQYASCVHKKLHPSDFYGAEHLFRLLCMISRMSITNYCLVKLPLLLGDVLLDDECSADLQKKFTLEVEHFMCFLADNFKEFFTTPLTPAKAVYISDLKSTV